MHGWCERNSPCHFYIVYFRSLNTLIPEFLTSINPQIAQINLESFKKESCWFLPKRTILSALFLLKLVCTKKNAFHYNSCALEDAHIIRQTHINTSYGPIKDVYWKNHAEICVFTYSPAMTHHVMRKNVYKYKEFKIWMDK